MPKTKPNKGVQKRFRLTANGRIKRKHAFKSHCLASSKKSTKQKRMLTHSTLVHKADMYRIRKLLNK